MRETGKITIKNGKSEIIITDKTIFLSSPEIIIEMVSGENSTSATTVTKDGIVGQVL